MAQPGSPPTTTLPGAVPVAVVGAGYAGLSAALSLHDRGVPALVLEASDRVGGRTWSRRTPGGTLLDHGGQWVGPTQRRLLAWAGRFGCATFPTWEAGEHLEAWHDGTVRRYVDGGPAGAPGLGAYAEAAARIDDLARRVDVSDPSAGPEAEAWDGETVQSFFERTVADKDARRRLALAVQGVWAMEPREISVLHLLFYVASAGGLAQLMDTGGAAQDARFAAGAQAPALAAAEHLGASVRLGCPVEAVDWDADGALLTTAAGPVRARRVVLAAPPPATAAIGFRPALPTARARWLQRSVMGDVAKVHAVYPRPFWRDEGLSGIATLYGDDAVGVVFDNSPPDAGTGVLVAFVYGDRYRRWSRGGGPERRASVLATLARLFGPAAGEPLEYAERLWPEDPWIRGGYAANPAPGAWVAHGAAGWRAPCGPLHWAGTETSEVWNGYIDGAIRSGERAAEEVLAVLER